MKKSVIVIGLGTGEYEQLSIQASEKLRSAESVYVRTMDHPVCRDLAEKGVNFRSFDRIYEQESSFEAVYDRIVKELASAKGDEVVYAVPGHPMVAEETVRQLRALDAEGQIRLTLISGESFLDRAFTSLGFDPVDGFQLLDGPRLTQEQIQPRLHILIGQVYDRFVASEVKLTLMNIYPDDHPVIFANKLGFASGETIQEMPLYEIDQHDGFSNHSVIYIRPSFEDQVLRTDFQRLKEIVATLRSPEGCPWDREQTHLSLRKHLIEEAYELIHALEQDDTDAMCEELGDVLLQVMLHAQMESEQGMFTIDDVVGQLSDKLIRRHPHVFGEVRARNAEEAIGHWDAMKAAEKEAIAKAGIPEEEASVTLWSKLPFHEPALLLAAEAQKKRGKEAVDPELNDLAGRLLELLGTQQPAAEQLAALLDAVVWIGRKTHMDLEHALRDRIRKATDQVPVS